MPPATRVLIVDDSPSVCRLLAAFLRPEPGLPVVGSANSGEDAIEKVFALKPDVVTLDLDMPGMGGLAALDRIMTDRPTPVLLLSGVSGEAAAQTVEGLALGAVDVLLKYVPGRNTDPAELRRELVTKVRVAAGVKVVRSLPLAGTGPVRAGAVPHPGPEPAVIVAGASTGGPGALRELLSGLPRNPQAGLLIVQHLPARFTGALAALLARQTRLSVREARAGDRLDPGVVLVAPGACHAIVGPDARVRLSDAPPVSGHRPSIDVAMESVARAFGPRAIGVLLTGMGDDGARGLAAVRAAGGTTFAQDADSCAVHGMPARAVELGAADEIDTPSGIAARIAARLTPSRGV